MAFVSEGTYTDIIAIIKRLGRLQQNKTNSWEMGISNQGRAARNQRVCPQNPPGGTQQGPALPSLTPFFCSAVEQDRDLFSPKPYWKEFRFDLTQVPAGEAVTAAEFRIYKSRGVPGHANSSLHVSIYEVAAQHSNR